MPLYSDSVLDEVRNAVNIVALVSEYVALKKRGRNYVARCPFHTEKTPSFNVNEEKQIFMCFGCGLGGDAFKFVMQIEHITFPEAIRFLAERNGISLPKISAPEPAGNGVDTDVLRQIMTEAAGFFNRALLDSEEGRNPRPEAVKRIDPPPAFLISGAANFAPKKPAFTCIFMIWS